jgi:hypothetical protein
MAVSKQRMIDAIRRLETSAERQQGYQRLAQRLEADKDAAATLEGKYALALWLRRVYQLIDREQ